jgi:hypothetical protein
MASGQRVAVSTKQVALQNEFVLMNVSCFGYHEGFKALEARFEKPIGC